MTDEATKENALRLMAEGGGHDPRLVDAVFGKKTKNKTLTGRDLNSITEEEFIALYKKHNKVPTWGIPFDDDNGCCGIGIVLLEQGFERAEELLSTLLSKAGVSVSGANVEYWGMAFDRGFRGGSSGGIDILFPHAYKIGQAMRKALDEGMFG